MSNFVIDFISEMLFIENDAHDENLLDAGPPILSMHSPFEVASKIDIYACFEAYKAFLGNTDGHE